MHIKIINGTDDLSDPYLVRDIVFTQEQGFTIPDVDENDKIASHIVVYSDNQVPIATGRVFQTEEGMAVGRIAVVKDYRQKNIGSVLMSELEKIAKKKFAKRTILHAQDQAVVFYEKCGYIKTGETHMEDFCLHYTMYKDL